MANGVATLEDVAKLAGVCISTVSRVLAARPGQKLQYAEKTQEKVRRAAEMLGYRPSRLARGLVSSRTGIVGLVVPSVNDSFFGSVASVIETELARAGYSVLLANTHSDPAIEQSKIYDLVDWQVDGLIIAPTQHTESTSPFHDLVKRNVSFVLIDRDFADTFFCSVTTDDYAGATMAVEHLLSIGCKRIAGVAGPLTVSTARRRRSGYMDTLIRHRILPEPSLMLEVPPTEEGGHMAVAKIAEMDPSPDGVFCFSDHIAIGVIEECVDRHIAIPDELALVGYADIEHARILKIPLTTIRQPRALLGEAAARMLIAQMDGNAQEPTRTQLPVELVVRESTVAGSRTRSKSRTN